MNELLPGQFFPTDHVEQKVDEDVDYSIPYDQRVQAKLAAQAALGMPNAEATAQTAANPQESTQDTPTEM